MPRLKSTHVDDPAAVGRRLKEARQRAGLSQRQLAFTGCTPAYISRIEAGDRIPSLQLLKELGARLGVSASYLATGAETADEAPERTALVDAEVALRLDDSDAASAIYEGLLGESTDKSYRSQALEGLGLLAFRAGEPQRAIALLQEAIAEVDDQAADRPALASALARSYALTGRLAESIAVLEACVERYEDDPVQFVRFAGLLGAALTDNGDYGAAERVLAKALRRGQEIADPYTRARLYWSQSRLRSERGQDELAAKAARLALATLRATEDTYAIGQAHQALAHVYLNQGKNAEALDLLQEGDSLMASAATPVELAQYRIEQARALAALGEAEEAGSLAMSVLSTLQRVHPVDSARVYLLLADVYEQIGEHERTKEILELAIETLEQQGPSRFLISAYRRLAELLKAQGLTEEAFALLERAVGMQERVGPLTS